MEKPMGDIANQDKSRELREKELLVESSLLDANNKHPQLKYKLAKDGNLKLLVYEDIDKTLVHLEHPTLYPEIRRRLWPNISKELIDKVHLDGFQLGTMFEEMKRMKNINNGERPEWVNIDVYKNEFLAQGMPGFGIENPENEYHAEAKAELERFDSIATEVLNEQYHKDPSVFESAKIQVMYHLNDLYRRLGVGMVGMSANPRGFIEAVCKYLGLAEYFADVATDTDVPGKKEKKMAWLNKRLEAKGVPIPYDRLLIIGDSPSGDVGSGPRFQSLMKEFQPELLVRVRGLLVGDTEEDIIRTANEIKDDPILREAVETITFSKVRNSPQGTPNIGGSNRKKFLRPLSEY